MDKFYTEMQFLEEEAHRHAFKDELGKYYWSKFLIYENPIMLSIRKNTKEDGKYHIDDIGKMVYQQF